MLVCLFRRRPSGAILPARPIMDHTPIIALLLLAVAGVIYFLPAYLGRNKRNAWAIFALNLLLGWTFLGWVAALVWALTKDAPASPPA